MGGSQPPFLYDPPSRYSFSGPTDFNPRAASMASWNPALPKPKQDGPLVNFNRHPDSWLIVPHPQKATKPMNPNTKTHVKYLRGLQMFLRMAQLVGLLGMLFCVITLRNIVGSIAWIIRVAPAVGLLHTVYGVYHLCRAATGRTPGSSASYHLFAVTVDAGLIPFLAFTATMCRVQYTTREYGWDTLFGGDGVAYWIVFGAFVDSTALGGLHIFSLAIGIWLATIFRRIAKLPPDMNPLEDNLTARPHKRNKSEFTLDDKRISQASLVSSKANSNRASDRYDSSVTLPRTVPFMHTRNGSSDNVAMYRQGHRAQGSQVSISPTHNQYQNSNTLFQGSRPDITTAPGAFYNHPNAPRSSRVNFDRPSSSHSSSSRPATAVNRGAQHQPSRPSGLKSDWKYPPRSPSPPLNDENAQPMLSPKENSDPDSGAMDIRDWYNKPLERKPQSKKDYLAVPSQDPDKHRDNLYDFDRDVRTPNMLQNVLSPLGMNPPSPSIYSPPTASTPQPQPEPEHRALHGGEARTASPEPEERKRIALSDADVNLPEPKTTPTLQSRKSRPSIANRPSSFVGSGTKGKYYGEVMNFSRGGTNHVSQGQTNKSSKSLLSDLTNEGYPSSSIYSDDDHMGDDTMSVSTLSLSKVGRAETTSLFDDQDPMGPSRQGSENDKKGRVVSNSSYEVVDNFDLHGRGYAGLGTDFGKGMASRTGIRNREVSGKVAEEGRGRGSIGVGAGAAGWARFKGL